MNSPSSTTVGESRRKPSTRSFSSAWPSDGRRAAARGATVRREAASAAPLAPPAIDRGSRAATSVPRLSVDPLQLTLRPLGSILGGHALDRLGIHVHDDVLRVGLAGLGARRPREPEELEGPRRGPVRQHHGIVFPHRVLFPRLGSAHAEALLREEPGLEALLGVEPLDELLRQLLVLRVIHDAVMEGRVIVELTFRTGRIPGVQDVALNLLALVRLVLVRVPQRLDVDRRPVQGGRDAAGQERAVVAGVVPRQPTLVARVLPEAGGELDRLDRLLGVDRDGLAVLLDLFAAPRPHVRIPESRRVAEGVTCRLTDREPLGLELLADLAVFLPGLRELLRADLGEERLAIRDLAADDRVRDRSECFADLRRVDDRLIEATLSLPDRLGDVGDVDQTGLVEVAPVVKHVKDVGAAAG